MCENLIGCLLRYRKHSVIFFSGLHSGRFAAFHGDHSFFHLVFDFSLTTLSIARPAVLTTRFRRLRQTNVNTKRNVKTRTNERKYHDKDEDQMRAQTQIQSTSPLIRHSVIRWLDNPNVSNLENSALKPVSLPTNALYWKFSYFMLWEYRQPVWIRFKNLINVLSPDRPPRFCRISGGILLWCSYLTATYAFLCVVVKHFAHDLVAKDFTHTSVPFASRQCE